MHEALKTKADIVSAFCLIFGLEVAVQKASMLPAQMVRGRPNGSGPYRHPPVHIIIPGGIEAAPGASPDGWTNETHGCLVGYEPSQYDVGNAGHESSVWLDGW